MPQEWTKPPEDTELLDVEQPVGSDDDLDDGGYDPADDPASREPEGSLPPSRDPGRGPTTYPVAPAAIPAWVQPLGNGKVPLDRMIKVAPLGAGYLVPEAAAAWRNLQNAASAAGFTLTMTGATAATTNRSSSSTSATARATPVGAPRSGTGRSTG